jgi:hypothetical protein
LRGRRRAVLAGGALPFVFAAHFPDAARDPCAPHSPVGPRRLPA